MRWLALLRAMLALAAGLAGWLRQRRLLEAGRAQAIAANLRAALVEIEKANRARDGVRRDVGRDPRRLRNDDGFKRSD